MNGAAIDLQSTFHAWLDKIWAPRRNAAKHLGRLGDVSPRTAEGWLAKKSLPQAQTLVMLMRNCDELKADVDQLINQSRETP